MLSCFSCVRLCAHMYYSHQGPWPMEFSRQEYRSGWPFPPPGDLPNPGIGLKSPCAVPALQADSIPRSHWVKIRIRRLKYIYIYWGNKNKGNYRTTLLFEKRWVSASGNGNGFQATSLESSGPHHVNKTTILLLVFIELRIHHLILSLITVGSKE